MGKYDRGSEWRRWELHLHTPETLKNDQYLGANIEEKWNKFYEDINSYIDNGTDIKRSITVLAITDYISMKNYLKVKQDNKLPDAIKLLLPNVELRMSPVANNAPINIHCIFNPDIEDELEDRFFSKLSFRYGERSYCAKESDLIRLGKAYKNDFALETHIAYKIGAEQFIIDKDNLSEIFKEDNDLRKNTIVVVSNSSTDGVTGVTQHSDYFIGMDRRSGSQLDATRQSIYQLTDAIFSGNDKDRKYFSGKGPDNEDTVIRKCGSLKPCFHGCDAHTNDKLFKPANNRFCWIKADPTFQGLKQVLNEPLERVFIGEVPEIITRSNTNSTKYITTLKIKKLDNIKQDMDTWFNNIEIHLNNGLVAIIGNKGSGKSAIADIIGLCGDSEHYENFNFLHKQKFLKKGLADQFTAKITFLSGTKTEEKNLLTSIDSSSDCKIQYLPQNYFETVCNEIGKVDTLRKEIKKVVFQYIPYEKKYQKATFDELIKFKSESIDEEINKLKNDISKINDDIIFLEDKLNPEYKKSLENKYSTKKEELRVHIQNKPKNILDISNEENTADKKQQEILYQWSERLDNAKNQGDSIDTKIADCLLGKEELCQLKRELEARIKDFESFVVLKKKISEKHSVNLEEIVNIVYDDSKITSVLNEIDIQVEDYKNQKGNGAIIDSLEYEKQSILAQIELCKREIKDLESKLSEDEQEHQKYKKEMEQWELVRKNIEGSNGQADSLMNLEKELKYINECLKNDLSSKRTSRIEMSLEIYRKKKEIKQIHDDIKQEISEVLAESQDQDLTINSLFSLELDFISDFLVFINKSKTGVFKGIDGGSNFLKDNLLDFLNLDNEESVKNFLQKVIFYFENDAGIEGENDRFIGDQILKRKEFYNFLFNLDYVVHHYELCQNGKTLEELSPGEKGALLLIFYLVLDKNEIPLIIDQPEDNLDNNSVANVLVPYIAKAKRRRQIIMVTHNPNLAIVADAEQIISVDIDKSNKNTFKFVSGSIENPIINRKIVDILEGTMPAFLTREHKYIKNKKL